MAACRLVGMLLLVAAVAACGDVSPASLVFVEISPAQPRLGDITTVKFAATDSRGMPAEGVVVEFGLQREVGGVKLAPTLSQTTQGSGEVITQVTATGRVASVVVMATAGDKVAQSPPISFAGSEVSARGITFQCGPTDGLGSGGIHALRAFGPGRDLIAGVKLECTAHVADKNGDGISGTLVSFLTEAGTIGPTAESMTDVIGNATVLYKTSYPLPQDVVPGKFTHEPVKDWLTLNQETHRIVQPLAPEWMMPWQWRTNPMTMALPDPACPGGCDEPRRPDPIRPGRLNNPRDNLVTMIAVTAGEEAYIDLNNNGLYDVGEPFLDTTEPFVDANDSGTWEPGELYIDTNGDGQWTGKNGVWDGSTLLWAQNRILWTGLPAEPDYQAGAPSNPPAGYIPTISRIQPLGNIVLGHFKRETILFRISDPWFNTFAQNSSGDGCRGASSGGVKAFPEVFGDQGIKRRYPPVVDVVVTVIDQHDPNDPSAPYLNPPADWAVQVYCNGTSSPHEGATDSIGIGRIEGTVH